MAWNENLVDVKITAVVDESKELSVLANFPFFQWMPYDLNPIFPPGISSNLSEKNINLNISTILLKILTLT